MMIGVDASNIRTGGGITHLVNLLAVAQPEAVGISRIRIWAARDTLDQLPRRGWLELAAVEELAGALPRRLIWQRRELPHLAQECDLLFAPGGSAPHRFSPLVTMSRNLLPFEWRELRRYARSPIGARLLLLRLSQARTFRRANGVIFLTRYAERIIKRAVEIRGLTRVIPHGITADFLRAPSPQRALADFSPERPLRVLYVSIVDLYKHQWHVASALAALRRRGIPVEGSFVGPGYGPALRRLRATLRALDPEVRFLRYSGPFPHAALPDAYAKADLCVFASSCENMPNILLEAMGAGKPIACSNRGPMPEVLGQAGLYFDPESPNSIATAIESLAIDPVLRARCAEEAYRRAQDYTWARCARDTLQFLVDVQRKTSFPPAAHETEWDRPLGL